MHLMLKRFFVATLLRLFYTFVYYMGTFFLDKITDQMRLYNPESPDHNMRLNLILVLMLGALVPYFS